MIQHLHPYDILALGSVTRWHTLRTARPQTLADHKARVALLAVWLGYRLPVGHFGSSDELDVLRLCLLHDIPETQFGDVPNPSKQALNRLTASDFDQVVERVFWAARGTTSPVESCSSLAGELLRIADVVEAACFYWTEGLTQSRPGSGHIPTAIVREALSVTRQENGFLTDAVMEVLRAATVPEDLLERLSEELAA